MCFEIPVYQYTSIPVAAITHATLVLMTAPWISTPLAAVEIEPVVALWTTSVPAALV